MSLEAPGFTHGYRPGIIRFGRGCVDDLNQTLADQGYEDVLIVTGTNVGSNKAVMGPVTDGLTGRSVEVFDETTPAKTLETVFDGIERAAQAEADVVVGVGGGSSLDIATGIAALARADYTLAEARTQVIKHGSLPLPEDDAPLPVVSIPTTLAGADLSVAAGLVASSDEGPVEVIVADERLMPVALFYDPGLFETTPMDTLAGSAINGFDKGIEAIYSRFSNPITDATAVRSLRYLRSSLPVLRETDDPAVMERAVAGVILAQYGVSVPNRYKINIVHAFGHALRNRFDIQQGVAHAVVVPHVLSLIFAEGGGRPGVLAEGLVTDTGRGDTTEAAVIEAVRDVRNGLGLPSRLRDLEGTSKDGLRDVAEYTAEDPLLDLGPPEFDPSIDDIEQALRNTW